MPAQVTVALAIEMVLIVATVFFMFRPASVFNPSSARAVSVARSLGGVFLCLTFCWSVIFGCVLALHGITFRV